MLPLLRRCYDAVNTTKSSFLLENCCSLQLLNRLTFDLDLLRVYGSPGTEGQRPNAVGLRVRSSIEHCFLVLRTVWARANLELEPVFFATELLQLRVDVLHQRVPFRRHICETRHSFIYIHTHTPLRSIQKYRTAVTNIIILRVRHFLALSPYHRLRDA